MTEDVSLSDETISKLQDHLQEVFAPNSFEKLNVQNKNLKHLATVKKLKNLDKKLNGNKDV